MIQGQSSSTRHLRSAHHEAAPTSRARGPAFEVDESIINALQPDCAPGAIITLRSSNYSVRIGSWRPRLLACAFHAAITHAMGTERNVGKWMVLGAS
jgi:hypothetical protein